MAYRPREDASKLEPLMASDIDKIGFECYDSEGNPVKIVGGVSMTSLLVGKPLIQITQMALTDLRKLAPQETLTRWINVPEFKIYSSRSSADRYADIETRTAVIEVEVDLLTGALTRIEAHRQP